MKNKFKIERFKKDGSKMASVKIQSGFWIEPHTQEEYDENIAQNALNKEQNIKDRFLYYPGTKIPSIHYMSLKQFDPNDYLKGGPMPWTDPSTIEINEKLLSIENIYDKLEEAKKNDDKKQIKFLKQPLVSWRCPSSENRKNLYAQGMVISNRNDKSDFVYTNLDRFEKAIQHFTTTYDQEYINTKNGIMSLINLLASKFCFRVGNKEDLKTGTGITTFRLQHITVDEKARLHFRFIGKKGVKWHKVFTPKTELEQKMYDGVLELKNKGDDFLFTWVDKRITSIDINIYFREIFEVKQEEEKYLSFHSWRHYNASKAFVEELEQLKVNKKIKKIYEGKSKNKDLRKARFLNKSLNGIFKDIAKILNDTPNVVRVTYSGGKIFKEFYEKHGIPYDEKTRSYSKKIEDFKEYIGNVEDYEVPLYEGKPFKRKLFCYVEGCNNYIKGIEYDDIGTFIVETGQKTDLRNKVWTCKRHMEEELKT